MSKRFQPLSSSWILLAGVLIALNALSSCAASRKATGSLRKDSPEYFVRKLETNQLNTKWFEAKARIDYDDGDQAVRATATIRMHKDSAVWVAVRKLGFEVARILVTQDSLFVIDRFNNEFGAFDLSYLGREYQLPASLSVLQNILLGNPLLLPTPARTLRSEGNDFWLEERTSDYQIRHLINGDSYRLEALEYQDIQAGRQMAVHLAEYAPTTGKDNFAYLRNMTLDMQQSGTIKVELKFSEVELHVPKNLPFEIPSRYARMQ